MFLKWFSSLSLGFEMIILYYLVTIDLIFYLFSFRYFYFNFSIKIINWICILVIQKSNYVSNPHILVSVAHIYCYVDSFLFHDLEEGIDFFSRLSVTILASTSKFFTIRGNCKMRFFILFCRLWNTCLKYIS